MFPLAIAPTTKIVAGIIGSAIAHQFWPKRINIDIEF
jgi:hypothetical protein